jgi:hypothetical protein
MKMNGNQLFTQSALPLTGLGYLPQFAAQGPFGSPLGGAIGAGFGGSFPNQTLPRPIGAVGGGFLPFSVDPITAAYVQQAQLAPQGFFGNLLGQLGQPLGTAIGSLVGQPNLGGQIGGIAGQLGGRFVPFSADPVTAAYAQQAQLGHQGFYGLPLGLVGQQLLGGVPTVLH